MCKLKKRTVFFIKGALLVFFFLNTPVSGWSDDNVPIILTEGGTSVLTLPKSLTDLIMVRFPDLRVPKKEDIIGDWATYTEKNAVPYACWGDFNGDGLTDVALILIGKERWRLVAFHQTDKGTYVDFKKVVSFPGPDENWYRHNIPQRFHIYKVKAGTTFKVSNNVVRPTPYSFDSIAFFLLGDPASGMLSHWRPAQKSPHETLRLHGIYAFSKFGALNITD